MAEKIRIKGGTRAQVVAAAAANALAAREPYLLTDESRLAIGTGASGFESFAKKSEADTDVSISDSLTLGANCDVFQNAKNSYGWRDNIATFVVKGSGAADPSWGTLFGGLEGYLFSATVLQRVFCDFHIDHDIARGTLLYPHVHWMPTTTATGVVRWGIEYTVAKGHQQGASSTFPATTTVYVNQTIAEASQWEHHVAEVSLAGAIPSTNIEPDSVIKIRVFRDAANAADTYPAAVHAWQCDLHYQVARLSTLNKSPNFYS